MPRPPAPPIPPPAPGQTRYRMLLAYDGAEFRGFAHNEGVPTVAGALCEALEQVLGHGIELTCAGRTDAGVHGAGQVVSFDAGDVDTAKVQKSLNRMCGPSIAVHEVRVAADDFDARHSAKGRLYHYLILNRAVPDPFLHRTTWHLRQHLDVAAMREAAVHLVGEHDFASFCRRKFVLTPVGEIEATLIRIVERIEWHELPGDILRLEIEASAFCQQMVRSITGTLVDVGRGKFAVEDVPRMLAAKDRSQAGQVAPPHGLTLMAVRY